MYDRLENYETTIFDARIAPYRSLSPAGFRKLLLCVALGGAFFSLPFYLVGAWPVVGFVGLDVALVYFAFRANYRAARAYERIRLTYLEFLLQRVSARGRQREWRFNPMWVKLEREDHEEFGLLGLTLISRGRRWAIGDFLGAEQRNDFALRLARALGEAKRGPQIKLDDR